ncbi:MAG: hypothetical protein PHE70_11830 [Tepidanaerobacteraceae bacterium]|jgi:hypothetical protein|nr:hypothetical protein [Tepidanaerobacteraceae bacterium]
MKSDTREFENVVAWDEDGWVMFKMKNGLYYIIYATPQYNFIEVRPAAGGLISHCPYCQSGDTIPKNVLDKAVIELKHRELDPSTTLVK